MNDDSLTPDEQALLAALPSNGSSVGNGHLRRNVLKWGYKRYFEARNALVDKGLLIVGKGKGGSARLALSTRDEGSSVSVVVPAGSDPSQVVEQSIREERHLYEPLKGVIEGEWAADKRTDPIAVEITALQGRRPTGGMWSRPDIVSVGVRSYVYVPGRHLEVISFEVKVATAITIQGVYEALAHRRAATRSYLLLQVPAGQAEGLKEAVSSVREVARAHGIGVITFGDPTEYQTWEELEEAQRFEPDPERLDSFIRIQLPREIGDEVAKRVH